MVWLGVGAAGTVVGSTAAVSGKGGTCEEGGCDRSEAAGFVVVDAPDATNSSSRLLTAPSMEALRPTFSRHVK